MLGTREHLNLLIVVCVVIWARNIISVPSQTRAPWGGIKVLWYLINKVLGISKDELNLLMFFTLIAKPSTKFPNDIMSAWFATELYIIRQMWCSCCRFKGLLCRRVQNIKLQTPARSFLGVVLGKVVHSSEHPSICTQIREQRVSSRKLYWLDLDWVNQGGVSG